MKPETILTLYLLKKKRSLKTKKKSLKEKKRSLMMEPMTLKLLKKSKRKKKP